MSFKRDGLQLELRLGRSVGWKCPWCNQSTLKLTEDNVLSEETAESAAAFHDENWEPDWVRGTFVAKLKCGNKSCEGFVGLAGEYRIEFGQERDEEGRQLAVPVYLPTAVVPTIDIFPIPEGAPETVSGLVRSAFVLFWADPSACVNRCGVALEQILTEVGVARYRRDNGLVPINLHQRIERAQKKYSKLAGTVFEAMFAAKWIRNAGSHEASLKQEDALDALELLSFVVDSLFDAHERNVVRVSNAINKKKGSRHSAARRSN